ncbi:diacylglycerol kinase 6-like [Prunus avium]|uniref:Diacylglycerol kinase 6-like n=1 Tax=Prunus avium TaxID=42229 RepID=A0A6P5SE02_PRUAV|nr:diacylglycerol kinase 6-like [Prunus avium]
MRIIVVGQDAVVNWILGVICDLKLPESPSIAPVPIPFYSSGIGASFGWKDILNKSPLQSLLLDVVLAKPWRTDSWHCFIRMKHSQSSTSQQGKPYSLNRIPQCLHEVGDVGKADNPTLYGRFWYEFRLDVPRNGLTSVAIVKVLNHLGQWKMLHMPGIINSICCLNLPMFDHTIHHRWVTKNTMEDGKTPKNPSFVPSFIDDGRLEVIGHKDWGSDWALLDQVRGIHFEFIEGAQGSAAYIIIDGGVNGMWHIPTNDLVEIEISYHGQVNILALPDCAAKSIHHSSQSSVSQANAKD